jgi:hypothetical protein
MAVGAWVGCGAGGRADPMPGLGRCGIECLNARMNEGWAGCSGGNVLTREIHKGRLVCVSGVLRVCRLALWAEGGERDGERGKGKLK